jgi:hypothetical protein
LTCRWRACIEVAEVAKRENMTKKARAFYKRAIQFQPYASQSWLEYAKLEEECGELEKCKLILQYGLSYCPYNEGLIVKAIRLEERLGNLSSARSVLARLRHVDIEKAWRTIMEGALLEARVGNIRMARRIFKVSDIHSLSSNT